MAVREITPDVDKSALLAGAQFIDAFCIMVDGSALDARQIVVDMRGANPGANPLRATYTPPRSAGRRARAAEALLRGLLGGGTRT